MCSDARRSICRRPLLGSSSDESDNNADSSRPAATADARLPPAPLSPSSHVPSSALSSRSDRVSCAGAGLPARPSRGPGEAALRGSGSAGGGLQCREQLLFDWRANGSTRTRPLSRPPAGLLEDGRATLNIGAGGGDLPSLSNKDKALSRACLRGGRPNESGSPSSSSDMPSSESSSYPGSRTSSPETGYADARGSLVDWVGATANFRAGRGGWQSDVSSCVFWTYRSKRSQVWRWGG